MEVLYGPQKLNQDGTVFENKIIYLDPTDDSQENDFALKIVADNVVVKNVLIYHAANNIGIYGWKPQNLTLENVQVIAYGNEWGVAPCPSRNPFGGYDCSNIKIYHSPDLYMNNVYVENGSRGISLVNCTGSYLTGISAFNVRGPFPGGQCVQFSKSHDSTLINFHCYNDLDIAWPEDSISAYRSSNVMIADGVVDGSNAPTGICVMFEGSDPDVHDGIISNVEARNC